MLNDQHTVDIKRETEILNTTTGMYEISGTATISDVACNWQPAGRDEIKLLPEGVNNRNVWLIITATEILLNDTIVKDGKEFRVHNVENFTGFGGSIGNYEGVCVGEDRKCG